MISFIELYVKEHISLGGVRLADFIEIRQGLACLSFTTGVCEDFNDFWLILETILWRVIDSNDFIATELVVSALAALTHGESLMFMNLSDRVVIEFKPATVIV